MRTKIQQGDLYLLAWFPHLRWYQHSDDEEEDVDEPGLLVLLGLEEAFVLEP